MSESSTPTNVTMQQLIDMRLNAFGLQLFVESIGKERLDKSFKPITFSYKGVLVTMQLDPDRPFDGRHQ